MEHVQPIAGWLLALALLAAGSAPAQEKQTGTPAAANPAAKSPQAQEERAANAGQPGGKSAEQAAKPAQPARKPPRRRSVQQLVGPLPSDPATPSYGPTLSPPAPMPAPSAAGAAPVSPPPAQINSCTGSFCTDASGNSYNAGVGNAAVNSQGRLCNRVGNTMQCF